MTQQDRRSTLIRLSGLAAALAAGGLPSLAGAQSGGYPSKIVNIVVPYPAGGPSDFVARKIQPDFSKALGQQAIVENLAGASGSLAAQKVLNAPADGHTIIMATPMELFMAPMAMQAVKHKPEDFKPAAFILNASMLLVTRKDLPPNTLDELVGYAKKPGTKELTFGSLGHGSMYHLVAEKFMQATGVKMTHVPYKGAAPLMQDLLGGQIDLVFIPLAGNTGQLVQEGRVKALGIAAKTPNPNFPNIPTLASSQALDDFEFDLWIGLQVPKATPDDVVAKINKAVNEALQNPETRKAFNATGNMVFNPMTPAEAQRRYVNDIARYAAVAKSINLQPQ